MSVPSVEPPIGREVEDELRRLRELVAVYDAALTFVSGSVAELMPVLSEAQVRESALKIGLGAPDGGRGLRWRFFSDEEIRELDTVFGGALLGHRFGSELSDEVADEYVRRMLLLREDEPEAEPGLPVAEEPSV